MHLAVPSVLHVAEFPLRSLHPVPDVPVLARAHVPAAKSLGCVSVPSAY